MVFLAAGGEFIVELSLGTMLLGLAWLLAVLAGAMVTGLKGHWGWLLIGMLFGGLPWILSAWLVPLPGSWWARHRGRGRPLTGEWS